MSNDLKRNILALVGTLETGLSPPGCFGVAAGNYDGSGLSYGVLQWNLRAGTLQPLLRELVSLEAPEANAALGQKVLRELRGILPLSAGEQIAWAEAITDIRNRHRLYQPYMEAFAALGATDICQKLQVKYAEPYFTQAWAYFTTLGLKSERGLALCMDICVQIGFLDLRAAAKVAGNTPRVEGLPAEEAEVARLQALGRLSAAGVDWRWHDDVVARKLAIANGGGVVHGLRIDLAADFQIDLKPAVM